MMHLSIRWKLTLWYAGVLAVVLTGFSVAVCWAIDYQILQRVDHGLDEELSDLLYEIRRAEDKEGLLMWLDRRFARHEGFDFQITTADGKRFFVNNRLADRGLALPEGADILDRASYQTVTLESQRYQMVVLRTSDGPAGPLVVRIARSLAAHDHEMAELRLVFFVVGPVTLLLTLGGGYFLARRALAPVQRISETARDITAHRLDRRIEVANPGDELGGLAMTLNGMMERLELSFKEMQRFTADAAHELRTPLAVLRNEAEVALRSPRSGDEYRQVLENLLEETNRLSQLADQLLFLCRQDAGLQPAAREKVEVDAVLSEVVGHMRMVAREKDIRMSLESNPPCVLRSDAVHLRRLFYNLLDNAIKYTPHGGSVTIQCQLADGGWTVCMEDTGIGIASEHLPHVFDRFYRADPARAGESGTGLGLAICQSIVANMGGRIEVHSEVGRGTRITVKLPA